jgi:hypothetical protein
MRYSDASIQDGSLNSVERTERILFAKFSYA